jgi:hypothetical protein
MQDGDPVSIEEIHERIDDIDEYDENYGNFVPKRRWQIRVTTSTPEGRIIRPERIFDWPYEWPAIIHCQNLPSANTLNGTSDLEEDLINLQISINFVLSNLMKIIRYHAHPRTWGSGFEADAIKVAVDETVVFTDPEASLHYLELTGDNIGSSVDYFKRLKEAFHQIARVPEVSAGQLDNIGNISGLAMNVLYQPLVEKTETKRSLYGPMLEEISMRLLEMKFGSRKPVQITWPELLPRDPLQERQYLLIDKSFGASNRTILTKLNYDWEREKARKSIEPQEDVITQNHGIPDPTAAQTADNSRTNYNGT